jgi:hypothetical protein
MFLNQELRATKGTPIKAAWSPFQGDKSIKV